MSRLSSIQGLRAIAAMMVVWHHGISQIPALGAFLPDSAAGANGVDLFFVISGFIMVLTTHGRDTSAAEFLRRRVIRVVPMYWLFTGLVILIAWWRPQLMRSTTLTPEHAIFSLLFIPHFNPGHAGMIWPILVPGWTLNLEMFFYALFALALAVRRAATVWLVAGVLALLVLTGAVAGPFTAPIPNIYTSPMLLQFGVGMGLGRLFASDRLRLPLPMALLMIVAGFALLIGGHHESDWRLTQTVSAGMIVAGALHPQIISWPALWLDELGDASYSIYLSHILTLGLVRAVWQVLFGPAASAVHAAGFMAAALLTAALLGVAIYRLVETPVLRVLTRATTTHGSRT